MVDMAREKENEGPEMEMEDRKYPYGLCLHLEDDDLQKLGITQLPPHGSEMKVVAVAKVVGTRTDEMADGEVEGSLRLQITDLELGQAKKTPDAGRLYEKDD